MPRSCRRLPVGLQERVRGAGGSDSEAPEEVLSRFFQSYAAGGNPHGLRLLGQMQHVVSALRAARSLPLHVVELSESPDGQAIREGLGHLGRRTYKTGFIRTPLHEVAAVLLLPTAPNEYGLGSSKQTVRRKARAAEKAGVHWTRVDDVDERLRLIALSEERERHHPLERYRSENVDNSRLLRSSLWLVAYSSQDVPLLIAAVPVDGRWSMLDYFRILEDTPVASNARYLMSWVLAEQLVERGVRYLADTSTMSNLPDGLRHFQHILGYRVIRLRFSPANVSRPRWARGLRSASRLVRPS